MIPENDKLQQEAVEALIAASLRVPGKEPDITDEEINRYMSQNVTLSSEDAAALEAARPKFLEDISKILRESDERSDQQVATSLRPEGEAQVAPMDQRQAPEEFVEAVVIAQLTRMLSTPEYPLGRKRYQKLAYLAHRKAEDDVLQHFLKKAAGPYSPWARYQGPETIALKNGYVKRAKVGVFSGLVIGTNIDKIDQYLPRYPVCAAIEWVVGRFKRRKNDDLELLATVDFAALDLRQAGTRVTKDAIKHIIATNAEWSAKLERAIFSDENICRGLDELRTLFPTTYSV